jgi:hypothetical protein
VTGVVPCLWPKAGPMIVASDNRSGRRRAKLSLVLAFHGRIHVISKLPWMWSKEAASAVSILQARQVIRGLLQEGSQDDGDLSIEEPEERGIA